MVVGFRSNSAASFFFDQDPAYHFTSAGQLRRAFREDRLYKADGGKLARQTRRRGEGRHELLRHDLDAEETDRFLAELCQRLATLRERLLAGGFQIVGQVSGEEYSEEDIVGRALAWLGQHAERPTVADAPNVA